MEQLNLVQTGRCGGWGLLQILRNPAGMRTGARLASLEVRLRLPLVGLEPTCSLAHPSPPINKLAASYGAPMDHALAHA